MKNLWVNKICAHGINTLLADSSSLQTGIGYFSSTHLSFFLFSSPMQFLLLIHGCQNLRVLISLLDLLGHFRFPFRLHNCQRGRSLWEEYRLVYFSAWQAMKLALSFWIRLSFLRGCGIFRSLLAQFLHSNWSADFPHSLRTYNYFGIFLFLLPFSFIKRNLSIGNVTFISSNKNRCLWRQKLL